MNHNKYQMLDKIRADIIVKNICPELAIQAKNLVMGDGSLDAEIMFIGEAPGKKEDETGVPFVGAAGRFLNDMLAEAGMDRSEVYITNIVKYRPPDNRDPLPAEKASFLPYLIKQIAIINPQVVVTLGRHSMEYFLPGEKISDVHGQPALVTLGEQEIVVIPLFHPAAALYNGKLRQTLIDDFLQIPDLINQIKKTNLDI